MARDNTLIVHVVGDEKGLTRTLKRSQQQVNKFAKNLDGAVSGTSGSKLGSASALLKGGGVAIGAGLAAREVASLSNAASDLNEQLTRAQVVFGRSAGDVREWARSTASSFGTSQTAALEAAGTFGLLFANTGQLPAESAKLSKSLVQLAADMASFNNTSVQDALDAIRSGLTGEIEPLRRYGVFLSEARTRTQALADTQKKSASDLTTGEKVLARYELLFKDTAKAQGDFARTSGGLANQQRILAARLADTRAELGTRLLPVMLRATEAANNLLKSFHGFEGSASLLNSQDFRQKFADAFGIDALRDAIEKAGPELRRIQEDFAKTVTGVPLVGKPASKPGEDAFGQPGFKPGKAPRVPLGPTIAQRNGFFDDAVTSALFRAGTQEGPRQIAALKAIEATITARIAITKDITRKRKLEDQLIGVQQQRKSVAQQLAEDLKADRLEKEAAAQRRAQARQTTALGLGVPGIENLRKQLDSLTARIGQSSGKLSSKLESQLKGVRRVLNGEFGKATIESRQNIQQLFETIRGDLENGSGPLTKTTSLNSDKILSGLGLGRDQTKELQARLSRFNSAGRALAPAQPVVVQAGDVYLDGRKVSASTRRHNTVHARANPKQKRGRRF